jgi:hypothetical protein
MEELMDRLESIANKADELRAELDRWAEEESILRPGEQLVFSLSIRPILSVVRDESDSNNEVISNDLLDMKVMDFFSVERLLQYTQKPDLARRAHKALREGLPMIFAGDFDEKTMDDFRQRITLKIIDENIPNVGSLCAEVIKAALNASGFILSRK